MLSKTQILKICHNIEETLLTNMNTEDSEAFKVAMFQVSSEMFRRNVLAAKDVDEAYLSRQESPVKPCPKCETIDISIVYRLRDRSKTKLCEHCGTRY